jgi:hypothetical protein
VSQNINRSQWFRSYSQKFVVIAFPIAFILSIIPFIIGLFDSQIALTYLLSAYIVVFLTIFGVCLILLGFHNQAARRLALVVAITSIIGVFANFWLLIETLFLGLQVTYPTGSVYLAAIANLVLLVGFALVSIEQRRRSWRQIGGYLLITILFLICILTAYQLNLTFNPPIFPTIGSGLRILIGFLTAIFAWSFYFNQDPPKEVIGQLSRFLLVLASLILLVSYTVFAFQYASGYTMIPAFFYSGSFSDITTLFAIFTFLIAIITIFTETLEKMATIRPISIKYPVVTRVVLILSLVVVLLLIGTIAIAITGQVLRVYLSPPDLTVALHTISLGLITGLVVLIVMSGGAAYYLSRELYRPLEGLEAETAAVTEPAIITYNEPPALLFTELQEVSDSYASLVEELSRLRAELRRFTISEPRLRTPSTSQLTKLDYYLAILSNSIANRIQSILSLSELGGSATTQEEDKHFFAMIQAEVNEIEDTMKSIQLLRLIDAQALPEFTRVDLCSTITSVINELQELIPESSSQITLSLPEQKCLVMANKYLGQIFHSLLRLALEQDVGGSATINVTFSLVTEFEVEYWQTEIAHPKWVLSDVEKVLLFRSDPEQPQKAIPNLLVVPALVDYFRGKFYAKNIVLDDPRYGTVFQILLPSAKTSRSRKKRSPNEAK